MPPRGQAGCRIPGTNHSESPVVGCYGSESRGSCVADKSPPKERGQPNGEISMPSLTIPEADISEFKSGLRGELIRPADAGYDMARKVFNAMIDRRPEF